MSIKFPPPPPGVPSQIGGADYWNFQRSVLEYMWKTKEALEDVAGLIPQTQVSGGSELSTLEDKITELNNLLSAAQSGINTLTSSLNNLGLNNLNDVNITSPASNHRLNFNGSDWVNVLNSFENLSNISIIQAVNIDAYAIQIGDLIGFIVWKLPGIDLQTSITGSDYTIGLNLDVEFPSANSGISHWSRALVAYWAKIDVDGQVAHTILHTPTSTSPSPYPNDGYITSFFGSGQESIRLTFLSGGLFDSANYNDDTHSRGRVFAVYVPATSSIY